jgi:crotonobetainyl-CoA:carnitine CoA-transferase CaiB-like acyl-CoA transferase
MRGLGRPLVGTKVVDLSRLLPGPFATVVLGDLGAEILKVEEVRGGDYARHYPPLRGELGAFFAGVNRNKRSVALDLKDPGALGALKAMLAGADVLIESFRPGVLARLGLSDEVLERSFPDLIVCSISGFGQTGPRASEAGHDLTYLARSGMIPGGQVPAFQLADLAGGALYAVAGILAALCRPKGSRGCKLDLSMTEGALSFLLPSLSMLEAGATPQETQMLHGALPCYAAYQTLDGRWMALAALEPKFWQAFCAAVEMPHRLYDGHLGGEEGEPLRAELRALFASRTQAEWVARLEGVDCCCAPVSEPQDLTSDPMFVERGVFFEVRDDRGEPWPQTATPLTPSARDEFLPPPRLGQHTREVLLAAGVPEAELEALFSRGAALQGT